jgi:hypothetical protein
LLQLEPESSNPPDAKLWSLNKGSGATGDEQIAGSF